MDLKRGAFAMTVGILMILGMTGLFAWMTVSQFLSMEHMDLMAAGVLILGSGVTAMCCGRGEGSIRRIVTSEILLVLILSLINLLMFDGGLNGLLPCILLIAGTAAAVILAGYGKTTEKYRKRNRKKYRTGKLNKKYSR